MNVFAKGNDEVTRIVDYVGIVTCIDTNNSVSRDRISEPEPIEDPEEETSPASVVGAVKDKATGSQLPNTATNQYHC